MNKPIEMSDKEIDVIYDGVKTLMKAEAWEFLDKHFELMLMSIWRTGKLQLLAYLTVTLPCKDKLPSRKSYLNSCRKLFPEGDLWKGL